MKLLTGSIIVAAAALGCNSAHAGLEEIVETTFRNGVVKVEVSSRTPVIRDGNNLCRSEGTAFLVSQSFVATAGHVFEVPRECGELTIVLKSRRHNAVRIGKIVASANDLALLSVNEPFPTPMCALVLMNADVYDTNGFRLGIPGQLQDPAPLRVRIGEKDSEWRPLVRLTENPAHFGESGGPVIFNFNVVGVLKSKHNNISGYSFMMVASMLRTMLTENRVAAEGRICNPVELSMGNNPAAFGLRASSELSSVAQSEVLKIIQQNATAAAQSAPELSAATQGSQVLIYARDKAVRTNECTQIGSMNLCSLRDGFLSAPAIANKAAADIKDLVASQLWKQAAQ